MRKLRFLLVIVMAVTICSGALMSTSIVEAASQSVSFGACSVTPGYVRRWFPTGDTGYTLTNGKNQTISVNVSTKGNKMGLGFMKYSSKSDYEYYSGTLNATSKTVTKVLVGATASYQPYVANRNETVYLKINSGYANMQ